MTLDPITAALFERLRAEREVSQLAADRYSRALVDLRARLLPPQLGLVDDDARFRVGLCARRAGKTTAGLGLMTDTALRLDEASVLYVAQTRPMAKRNMWRPLKKWLRGLDVAHVANETELQVRMDGDRRITLASMEDPADADKLRGDWYDLVVLDEGSFYRPELLSYAVDECISPALADRDGTLVILGTPGRYFSGTFYEATGPHALVVDEDTQSRMSRPYALRHEDRWQHHPWSWSLHTWKTQDNTAVPGLWDRILRDKRRKQWGDDHPIWRREYLAEWVADLTGYVYRYQAQHQDWDCVLPPGHDWLYAMGVDLGTKDAFAVVVLAWARTSRTAYVVDEYAERGLGPSGWAEHILRMVGKWPHLEVTVDAGGLGTGMLLDLQRQHGVSARAVDKAPGYKESSIESLNDDMHRGLLKVRRDSALAQQMMSLQWEHRGTRRVEDPRAPNDRCDAALYAWRTAGHHEVAGESPRPLGESQADVVLREAMERETGMARDRAKRKQVALSRWGR